MLRSTALGVPRFSMTRERRSSSTRRKSLPKLVRACRAETTILSVLPFLSIGKCSVQLYELYSLEYTMSTIRHRLGSAPDFADYSLEIRSQHLFDYRGGLA